jgi:uncharacterized damage-inducible protein DinB
VTVAAALERNRQAVAALLDGDPAVLDRTAPRVSQWSVGQQLEHILLVDAAILGRVLEAPEAIEAGPKAIGYVFLGLGWIPRGVGKSPERVRPTGRPLTELRLALTRHGEALARLAGSPHLLARPECIVPHPRFGGLTGARALRFLDIHDRHHLRIVRDIQRA